MSSDTSHLSKLSTEEQLAWYKKELEDKNLIIDTILESTMAGYWDWLIQENTEYLSPTFKKMFGYEDHEMENHPDSWQKIIHPDDLPNVFECFNAHVESKGKVPFSKTVRYAHKDGSTVNVFCSGQVVQWDEEGKPIRMIGAHIDITPLKQIEQQFTLRNNELEDFAYATSHDLKEPLRTISSFIELLGQEGIGDDQKKQYLDIIGQSSKRMTLLIQGLLDHSRIGKELELESVNVGKLLDDLCSDLNHSIEDKQAKIEYAKELATIQAYPTELRTLFQNLVSNGIKFMPEGRKPEIQITHEEDKYFHIFHVKDNGIGILPEKQDKIFKLFARLNPSNDYEGTGIGLTHCKKIAEIHKGSIKVSASGEDGTTFSIYINRVI